jgi:alkylhydroperoxidase family enzyme
LRRPREASADAEASGTGAARIEPGGFAQLWPVNWLIWRLLSRLSGTSGSQLLGTIGLAGGLFRAWLYFGARLMPGGKLKRYQCELVILRVAWLRDCRYVFDHHRRMGRRHGITHDVIDRIAQGSTAPGWTSSEVALLSAAETLVSEKSLSDRQWQALTAHFDHRRLIELCLLVGHYDVVATMVDVLRIQQDTPRTKSARRHRISSRFPTDGKSS